MNPERVVAYAAVVLVIGVMGMMPIAAQSDDIAALSDEFSDAATLAQWKRHDAVEAWPNQTEVIDVSGSSPGHLYLEPFTSVDRSNLFHRPAGPGGDCRCRY